jgi:hypothetical protein
MTELVETPDYIDPEALQGFLDMRKAKGKRFALTTKRAMTLLLNKLEQAHNDGYDVNAMLDEATVNNWQSVYAKPHHKKVHLEESTEQKVINRLAELSDTSWAH